MEVRACRDGNKRHGKRSCLEVDNYTAYNYSHLASAECIKATTAFLLLSCVNTAAQHCRAQYCYTCIHLSVRHTLILQSNVWTTLSN